MHNQDVKRILLPLSIFAAYLSVVGIGASISRLSPLSKAADLALLSIHLGLIILLSVLLVRERLRNGKSRSTVLLQIGRWCTDDPALGVPTPPAR